MNKRITKTTTIEQINLTSSEWQLYHDYKTVGGNFEVDHNGEQSIQSAACAITMNRTFTRAVNEGLSATQVYALVQEVARDFRSGGTDTESRHVLLDLLEEVFGEYAVRACY